MQEESTDVKINAVINFDILSNVVWILSYLWIS